MRFERLLLPIVGLFFGCSTAGGTRAESTPLAQVEWDEGWYSYPNLRTHFARHFRNVRDLDKYVEGEHATACGSPILFALEYESRSPNVFFYYRQEDVPEDEWKADVAKRDEAEREAMVEQFTGLWHNFVLMETTPNGVPIPKTWSPRLKSDGMNFEITYNGYATRVMPEGAISRSDASLSADTALYGLVNSLVGAFDRDNGFHFHVSFRMPRDASGRTARRVAAFLAQSNEWAFASLLSDTKLPHILNGPMDEGWLFAVEDELVKYAAEPAGLGTSALLTGMAENGGGDAHDVSSKYFALSLRAGIYLGPGGAIEPDRVGLELRTANADRALWYIANAVHFLENPADNIKLGDLGASYKVDAVALKQGQDRRVKRLNDDLLEYWRYQKSDWQAAEWMDARLTSFENLSLIKVPFREWFYFPLIPFDERPTLSGIKAIQQIGDARDHYSDLLPIIYARPVADPSEQESRFFVALMLWSVQSQIERHL